MSRGTCKIDGCERTQACKGMCPMHYARMRRHGDANHVPQIRNPRMKEAWILAASESSQDDCIDWPWLTVGGYGIAPKNHHGTTHAHRQVLQLVTGEPGEGMVAAHAPVICHRRACCNPRHLLWATDAENQSHKYLDGTHFLGEQNPNAKLTPDQASTIFSSTEAPAIVAAKFGISVSHVRNIRAGQYWAHVTRASKQAVA